MLAAVRYRRGQAVVILVLSALVTAGAAFAPLYTRALQQAVVATLLDQAPVARAGVRIASTSASEPYLALFPARLADLVPAQVRAASRPAVRQPRGRRAPDAPGCPARWAAALARRHVCSCRLHGRCVPAGGR